MADVVYQYGADIKQILDALNQIDKTNEKVYQKAERAANRAIKGIIADHNRLLRITDQLDKSIAKEAATYDKLAQAAGRASKNQANIGASGKASGLEIGAVAGIVTSLTNELINLGKAGVDALVQIGEQSVQTAIQMDTLKARLGGIFGGSQEAADQAFTFIQDKSRELGIDLSELAGAFIPKTESLDQFERVAKLATALARSDPEQGAIGARIALIEALSGTFTSLQRRFEIPKGDIDRIKEAFDTKGMEGFISTLEQVLAESGKSFEDLANTAQTSFDRLGIAGQQLSGRLGQPIVDALQQASEKILSFINENEDELIVFADTIGRAIGEAIDFISSIDFSGFDTGTLIQIGDYIFRIIQAAQLAATQIVAFAQAFSQLPGVAQIIQLLAWEVRGLDDALLTLSQILALGNAALAAFEASTNKAQVAFLGLSAAVKASHGDLLGAYDAMHQAAAALVNNQDAQKAYTDSILASNAQFEEYYQSLQDNKQAQDNLRDSLNEAANAGTGAADAIMGLKQANAQAAADADKLAEAQGKVNEKMAEAQKDFSRKLEDIDIETERKRLDIAIEFAQKREDAARDNLRKLEDINRKYQQDVDDAATDLSRKEEDIARKFGQERIDLERENRQERLQIETDYRQKLQDIQGQFLLDAEEAERSRDAVAFLRAVRERDKKVQEAQVERSRSIEEQRVTNQQKLEELRIAQQREIEEARIANERKLEDLRTNLNRQIEEQNRAYQRQLADIQTSEERKFEELQRSRERDIEDARRAYERKLEDLRIALAEELALIEEFAAKKAAAEANAGSGGGTTTNYNPSGTEYTIPYSSTGVPATKDEFGLGGPQGAFADGGFVSAKKPALVGEKGPELFVPKSPGLILPNNFMSKLSGSTYNQSKQINLSIPADRLTPGQRAEARQIALEVLGSV